MGDIGLDIKENVLELLRNRAEWDAFRSSPDAAVKIARGWGLKISKLQAVNIIYVISVYLAKVNEANLTFINTVVPGSILLKSTPAEEAPRAGTKLDYLASGRVGNGPVPKLFERVAPLEFQFQLPGYMLLSAAGAFGL